jgi:hypothetical protein
MPVARIALLCCSWCSLKRTRSSLTILPSFVEQQMEVERKTPTKALTTLSNVDFVRHGVHSSHIFNIAAVCLTIYGSETLPRSLINIQQN